MRRRVSAAQFERREADARRRAERVPEHVRLEGPIPESWGDMVTVARGSWSDREGCYLSELKRAPSGAHYMAAATVVGWERFPVAITEER